MSVAKRQQTCAVCGAPFARGENTELELLIDDLVRYVAVHPQHSTYAPIRAQVTVLRPRAKPRSHEVRAHRYDEAA